MFKKIVMIGAGPTGLAIMMKVKHLSGNIFPEEPDGHGGWALCYCSVSGKILLSAYNFFEKIFAEEDEATVSIDDLRSDPGSIPKGFKTIKHNRKEYSHINIQAVNNKVIRSTTPFYLSYSTAVSYPSNEKVPGIKTDAFPGLPLVLRASMTRKQLLSIFVIHSAKTGLTACSNYIYSYRFTG